MRASCRRLFSVSAVTLRPKPLNARAATFTTKTMALHPAQDGAKLICKWELEYSLKDTNGHKS